MPGLAPDLIEEIDVLLTLRRIATDIRTDLILAPHFASTFANVGDQVAEELRSQLRSGSFEPALPITIEVPKWSGLTRPGSILNPSDRFVYQTLIDLVAQEAEAQLDRERVFSNVLLPSDPEGQMFEPTADGRRRMQLRLRELCDDPTLQFVIRADVASFFERLYQHNLINLLSAANCAAGAVNLLEKLLLAWMEKDSHGILQGVFPSDFLGNFYLHGLDSDLATRDVPSVRYMDDLYIFYPTLEEARHGLMELCKVLRQEGLHLNERKTGIVDTDRLLKEETKLDALFQEAREEVEKWDVETDWYNFQVVWLPEAADLGESEAHVELLATERLYSAIEDVKGATDREKIEKFCLPVLAAGRSEVAVERSLSELIGRPHMSQLYCTYLGALATENEAVGEKLVELTLDDRVSYDWQRMWLVATLLKIDTVPRRTVNGILRMLRNPTLSIALRAVCAIVIGRHGHAGQRRMLKHWYADEPSEYVRAAILFAARYFPAAERRTAVAAWSGHSRINGLVARAVQAVSGSGTA